MGWSCCSGMISPRVGFLNLQRAESHKEINDPGQWQWQLPPPLIITTSYQPLHRKKNVLESEWLNKCNKMKQLSSRGTNSRSSWFPAVHTQTSWDRIASLCLQSCIAASEGLGEKTGVRWEKRKRKGIGERGKKGKAEKKKRGKGKKGKKKKKSEGEKRGKDTKICFLSHLPPI